MTQTFIQNAFILKWYNGKPIDVFDIPYMSDATSFRIGAVRLRQNRVPKGKLYTLFLLFNNLPRWMQCLAPNGEYISVMPDSLLIVHRRQRYLHLGMAEKELYQRKSVTLDL